MRHEAFIRKTTFTKTDYHADGSPRKEIYEIKREKIEKRVNRSKINNYLNVVYTSIYVYGFCIYKINKQ